MALGQRKHRVISTVILLQPDTFYMHVYVVHLQYARMQRSSGFTAVQLIPSYMSTDCLPNTISNANLRSNVMRIIQACQTN